MQIRIQNRLPGGLESRLELATEFMPMVEMLKEEGIDQLVQPFYEHMRKEMDSPERKGKSFVMWEGYWADQENGIQNLYIVGILHNRELWHSRAMRVKHVPKTQRTEVEKALTDMMLDYLDGLFEEIERTIKPGSGKTNLSPARLH